MIDSNATIGSCASIGNRVHISANALIGGVLEPLSETPVIIEDDVFIGAASSITSGILISEGAVIASGVHISPSTRIYDSINNTTNYVIVPPKAVVVSGTVQKTPDFSLNAAIIVKYRDSITDSKIALNDLLHVI
jgi:2,3,4,5-tetrahydropyridine-2,6-dicarboxylate N-succinyltransferase